MMVVGNYALVNNAWRQAAARESGTEYRRRLRTSGSRRTEPFGHGDISARRAAPATGSSSDRDGLRMLSAGSVRGCRAACR